MILNIRHADGFRDVGLVTIIDGVVKSTEHLGNTDYDPLKGMKGWAEKSVRQYAMSCNWIVSVREGSK